MLPMTIKPDDVSEYQRHVFGATSCSICTTYALERVGLMDKIGKKKCSLENLRNSQNSKNNLQL